MCFKDVYDNDDNDVDDNDDDGDFTQAVLLSQATWSEMSSSIARITHLMTHNKDDDDDDDHAGDEDDDDEDDDDDDYDNSPFQSL